MYWLKKVQPVAKALHPEHQVALQHRTLSVSIVGREG